MQAKATGPLSTIVTSLENLIGKSTAVVVSVQKNCGAGEAERELWAYL